MRKLIAVIALALGISAVAAAQPRAVGVRLGAAASATYQHYVPNAMSFMKAENAFVTGDLDINITSPFGFSLAGTYDLLNPFNTRIPWSYYGNWNWHLGAGLGLGYGSMADYHQSIIDPTKVLGQYHENFHIGIAARVGVEYELEFPMTVGVEWRPTFGPSFYWDATKYKDDSGSYYNRDNSNVGFSSNALWQGALAVTVKYRF